MVRNALRRKLFRDMWQNRLQFLAVILLCALGSWVFSGLDASWRMLETSAQTYFEEQNLADLWVTRSPVDRNALTRMRSVRGVADAQARLSVELTVDLPHEPTLLVQGYEEAVRINRPLLQSGETLLESDLRGCLLDERFAQANGLSPGDRLTLLVGGQPYTYTIRGLCLSAEYLSLAKSATPDPLNYGFVILNAASLPLLSPNGAVLTLAPEADTQAVKEALEALYPEALVIGRDAQSAVKSIQMDVDMFRNLSYVFPLLAFAVAAMIVLTTVSRMLENQRIQMGTLKALGYRDGQLRRHYLSYAFYPSLVGSFLGLFVGRWTIPWVLWNMEIARHVFPYRLNAPVSAAQWTVCGLGVVLSCLICLFTYRNSAREQTAALLRPKPPRAGRKLLLERWKGLWNRMGFNAKMVMRNLMRNKARTIMSLMGVLCCNMLIITSLGLQDSVAYFVGKYYFGTLRYDVRADLTQDAGQVEAYRKRVEAGRLEGVMDVALSARGNGNALATLLTVLEDDQRLINLGKDETWIPLPAHGAMLSQKLAETLGVKVGDALELCVPGDPDPLRTWVSGIAEVTIGQTVYMSRSAWEEISDAGFKPTALLVWQPTQESMRYLSDLGELESFSYPTEENEDTLQILNSMMGAFSLMSGAALGLAFVVLYNMGILNFTERTREYATLKVLGYHQKEIRRLMRAENNLMTLLGVLLGIGPGWWLVGMVFRSCERDNMVFVYTVKGVSVLVACAATCAFSYLVSWFLTRKVRAIDMVEALKSVE